MKWASNSIPALLLYELLKYVVSSLAENAKLSYYTVKKPCTHEGKETLGA